MSPEKSKAVGRVLCEPGPLGGKRRCPGNTQWSITIAQYLDAFFFLKKVRFPVLSAFQTSFPRWQALCQLLYVQSEPIGIHPASYLSQLLGSDKFMRLGFMEQEIDHLVPPLFLYKKPLSIKLLYCEYSTCTRQ